MEVVVLGNLLHLGVKVMLNTVFGKAAQMGAENDHTSLTLKGQGSGSLGETRSVNDGFVLVWAA